MKIIVIGDIHVSCDTLEKYAKTLAYDEEKEIVKLEWKVNDKDEFQKRILNLEKNGVEAEEIPDGLLEEIEDTDIILDHHAPIPRKVIERAKKLKLIGTCRGGLEHIDIKCATERKIPVIHVIRNAEPVADFTLGLLISETRNIARSHHVILSNKWQKEYPNSTFTTNLRELTVGLIGLGHIGKLLARRLNALNMKVIAHDPYVTAESIKESGLQVELHSMEYVFSNSDVVSLHLRASKETEKVINKDYISLMKPTAYLINTSRASVVDEEALIEALQNKSIAGAAIDVFWKEPIPKGHPILKLDNVTLTPHIAGDTVDAIPRSPKLLCEAINEFISTGKSDLVVNLKNI
jgi:D-3-phosphoglycerate dehydrogenase